MNWITPEKPAEITENQLIDAILEGHFPIGSLLPAERELASQLGVTRPTLREALQRLARDGWIDIHQGKSTRVRDYWREGNLGVLGAIARRSNNLPTDFVPNLLFIRQLLAPAYARLAVERQAARVVAILEGSTNLEENPSNFAAFDWELHHELTIASGNPVFTLILNGFKKLYYPMACLYFQYPAARASSRLFYAQLLGAAQAKNGVQAEATVRQVMAESLALWQETVQIEDLNLGKPICN